MDLGSGRFQETDQALFIKAILKGFPAVDENDRNFVFELLVSASVLKDINFLPRKLVFLPEPRELDLNLFT